MARTFEAIDDRLAAWIERQPVFFVGTAPLSAEGHVNVSPKGPIGTFALLGPRRVAYLDHFGSGAETIAHLRENGRVVVEVTRIAQSCGYGVPLMEQVGEREHFELSKRKRLRTLGSEELAAFQATRNATSIDGLPAVDQPRGA
jgi:hypothetical protein